MTATTTSFLKRSFLFSSLSEKELKVVSSFCTLKKVSKGQSLFAEGDLAQAFFFIVYGKIKIFKISLNRNLK